MKFFTQLSRLIKTVVAAVMVAGAVLVVPGGAAHAGGPNFGVLVGQNPNGPGGACGDQNQPGVYLYSDIDYQGRCAYFPIGALGERFNQDSINRSVGNDKASSIRIVNGGGCRYLAQVYLDKNFKGSLGSWTSDEPDLRNWSYGNVSLNDNISSMYVTWY